jgi:hypothetical protein
MKIKRLNEMSNDMKIITPEHISKMEYEMGEWIVDVVDASMYFNKPEVKERYDKFFEENHPDIMKLVKEQDTESKESRRFYRELDISEAIHNLLDEEKISEEDYFKCCADIYNLDEKVNEFFWEMWEEYELNL